MSNIEDFIDREFISKTYHCLFLQNFNDNDDSQDHSYTLYPEYKDNCDLNTLYHEPIQGTEHDEKFKIAPRIKKSSKSTRKYSRNSDDPSQARGKWTESEEDRYYQFIRNTMSRHPSWNKKQSNKKRRNYFKEMSMFIETRTSTQCRSHDQKFRHKYMHEDQQVMSPDNSTEISEETYQYGNRRNVVVRPFLETCVTSPVKEENQVPVIILDDERHEKEEDSVKEFGKEKLEGNCWELDSPGSDEVKDCSGKGDLVNGMGLKWKSCLSEILLGRGGEEAVSCVRNMRNKMLEVARTIKFMN